MLFSQQEMRLFLVHQGSMLMYPFKVCITCFLSKLFLYLGSFLERCFLNILSDISATLQYNYPGFTFFT